MKKNKPKFFFITTIPLSLKFYEGQIVFLKKEFDVELVSSPGELLNKASAQGQVQTHSVSMEREISIIRDIMSLFNLIRLFLKKKPSIIHSGTPKAGLLGTLAGVITRIPIRIYYLHGLRYEGTEGAKRKLLIIIERLVCWLATDIYAVSQGVKKTIQKDKITSKKINVIGEGSVNGISTDYFNPRLFSKENLKIDMKIPSNGFVFGFVGRLVKDKGIEELVKAFLELKKSYNNIFLLIVGGYEDFSNPVNEIIKKQIEEDENIFAVGFQEEIRPYLSVMDVFVLPSYREGFGMSLAEALSMEIPVIASNITGCNEIVNNNQTGLLVPAKSVEKLQQGMEKLLLNKEQYETFKRNGRKSIENRFSQKIVWERTLASYSTIKNSRLG